MIHLVSPFIPSSTSESFPVSMADPLRSLVDDLIKAFPDTYPPISLTEKEFAFRAGQVDIVRRLKEADKRFDPNLDLN